MRNLFHKACKSDRDGMTAIYAAIAASLIVMASPVSRPASAQVTTDKTAASFNGDWQGALDVQTATLRLVLHVTTTDGRTDAVLVSTDQNEARLPATTIERAGDTMKFDILTIDGHYTGKVSADEHSVDGTWSQNGVDLPLTLTRQ
jgi:hypothetical protein